MIKLFTKPLDDVIFIIREALFIVWTLEKRYNEGKEMTKEVI